MRTPTVFVKYIVSFIALLVFLCSVCPQNATADASVMPPDAWSWANVGPVPTTSDTSTSSEPTVRDKPEPTPTPDVPGGDTPTPPSDDSGGYYGGDSSVETGTPGSTYVAPPPPSPEDLARQRLKAGIVRKADLKLLGFDPDDPDRMAYVATHSDEFPDYIIRALDKLGMLKQYTNTDRNQDETDAANNATADASEQAVVYRNENRPDPLGDDEGGDTLNLNLPTLNEIYQVFSNASTSGGITITVMGHDNVSINASQGAKTGFRDGRPSRYRDNPESICFEQDLETSKLGEVLTRDIVLSYLSEKAAALPDGAETHVAIELEGLEGSIFSTGRWDISYLGDNEFLIEGDLETNFENIQLKDDTDTTASLDNEEDEILLDDDEGTTTGEQTPEGAELLIAPEDENDSGDESTEANNTDTGIKPISQVNEEAEQPWEQNNLNADNPSQTDSDTLTTSAPAPTLTFEEQEKALDTIQKDIVDVIWGDDEDEGQDYDDEEDEGLDYDDDDYDDE